MIIVWQPLLVLFAWLLLMCFSNRYAESGTDGDEYYSLICQQQSVAGRLTIILFSFAWYVPLFLARTARHLWHGVISAKETVANFVIIIILTSASGIIMIEDE